MPLTSLKTYVPAGRTCPGTATAMLNVTMTFLSHWSALAPGTATAQNSAAHSANTIPLTVFMILPSWLDDLGRTGRVAAENEASAAEANARHFYWYLLNFCLTIWIPRFITGFAESARPLPHPIFIIYSLEFRLYMRQTSRLTP